MIFKLLFITIISAALYIYTNSLSSRLKYLFKPLTTILVITIAIILQRESMYGYLIIAGLVFSLFGDVFLMLPKDKFVQGLASFLIAHIFYIVAFGLGFGPYFELGYLIPAAIYAIVFLWILLPKTGKMKIPVMVYALVLMVFLWQALGRFYYLGNQASLYIIVGAVLFVISDTILAYARFVKNFNLSPTLIHVTYWGAQLFIALSI
ncbi:MAG: lysoplasmalogenase [Bacteroidota bacterium]